MNRKCNFYYEQRAGQDDHYCPVCGDENYYVLETYYDTKGEA